MKAILLASMFATVICHGYSSMAQSARLNQKLAAYIDSLATEDQKPVTAKDVKDPEKAFKEITARHIPLLKNVIKKYGFPGYNQVGRKSSDHFWMLVQHSDADLAFQQQALSLMRTQVEKKNASGDKYAYLVDRVRVNQGKKQLYGTQIGWATGSPVIKPVEDSAHLDKRRKEVGMPPVAEYLENTIKAVREINEQRNAVAVSFNQPLADTLAALVPVDQIAANIPQGKYKELSKEDWQHYKDSVFGTHQHILEDIFNRYGYPGYDLVGEQGSKNYWLMVQHCDHTPAFQEKVLTAMKTQVDKHNADPANYAYLTDRVRLNTNRKQVYGTQVTYNLDSCQAIPKPLEEPATVNERRKEMGLEPLEQYMNMMSEFHLQMNKDMYTKKGITKAKLYPVQ